MKQLEDYILVVPNIVSLELCDSVLTEYKECSDWINAAIKGGENLGVRNCKTIGISFSSIMEKNKDVRLKIDQELFNCAAKAIQEYKNHFVNCTIEQDSGYDLLKYETGGFYTTHTDSFKDRPRAVSCSFLLNDNYEGGEFAFFDRELVYKLKKGSCIMFPSNFMYPHEIMPVVSGTRYSIVTWFV
jgi:predicted 2-oxoglutarate/Fe(II)-dependent dioxygenase YbiX